MPVGSPKYSDAQCEAIWRLWDGGVPIAEIVRQCARGDAGVPAFEIPSRSARDIAMRETWRRGGSLPAKQRGQGARRHAQQLSRWLTLIEREYELLEHQTRFTAARMNRVKAAVQAQEAIYRFQLLLQEPKAEPVSAPIPEEGERDGLFSRLAKHVEAGVEGSGEPVSKRPGEDARVGGVRNRPDDLGGEAVDGAKAEDVSPCPSDERGG